MSGAARASPDDKLGQVLKARLERKACSRHQRAISRREYCFESFCGLYERESSVADRAIGPRAGWSAGLRCGPHRKQMRPHHHARARAPNRALQSHTSFKVATD